MAQKRRSPLGELLEECMADRGMGQGAFGQAMGVSQAQINRWLTGDGEPTFEERLQMARLFQQPPWHFLTEEQRLGVGNLFVALVTAEDGPAAVRRAMMGTPAIDPQALASIRAAFDRLLQEELGCSLNDLDPRTRGEILERLRRPDRR